MSNDLNAFDEYSNDMLTFIKILNNIIQIKKKVLILFDDMIADMLSNTKFNIQLYLNYLVKEEN